MIWPFKKMAEPSQPKDLRDDSEGWLIGDLALCLTSDWPETPSPQKGKVYRVSSVIQGPVARGNEIGSLVIALHFSASSPNDAYNCTLFRKIKPDAEPCDVVFAALIKHGARRPVGV